VGAGAGSADGFAFFSALAVVELESDELER
jgi:hypothetical protein